MVQDVLHLGPDLQAPVSIGCTTSETFMIRSQKAGERAS